MVADRIPADLHFPTNGYAVVLSLVYVPFCVLIVPRVMLTRKIGPRINLPTYMIGWGSMAMINAGARSYAGSIVIRTRQHRLHIR